MTKIIQRHDTAANWTAANPVLAAGEMGVETDTNKFKFGDGVTAWNNLSYAAGEGGGGGSGTTLTSADGVTTYSKLALGSNLIVDTGDIPWTNPQMTSNSQDGYVASASASSSEAGSAIWKAFDKDTTTSENAFWTGSVSMPQWIMLECPKPVRLTSCMIMNEVATPANFKSGYIQGSNDGSVFDTLYTITDRPDTAGLQETYTFDNNTYYKYLRVYCTESHYGNGLSIQEIEFSGFTKDPTVVVPILDANLSSLTEQIDKKQDKLTAIDPITIKNQNVTITQFEQHGGNLNSAYVYTKTITESDYIQFKKELPLSTADTWEIGIKFNVLANSWGATYNIISTDSNNSIYFTARNNTANFTYQFDFGFTFNGTEFSRVGFSNISSNHILYVKLTFDGSNYICGYNESGWNGSFNNDVYPSANKVFSNPILNILKDTIANGYIGAMYLGESYYTINGVKTPFVETIDGALTIEANKATTSSLGVVQPDGTSITVSETGIISSVGGVQSPTIHSMVVMTQAEYDALATKDDTVLYLIREETV